MRQECGNAARMRESGESAAVLGAGCRPMATEWCFWVPREANRLPDKLATKAIQDRRTRIFVSGRPGRFASVELVASCDAGQAETGEVGIGIAVYSRRTLEPLVLIQRYRPADQGRRPASTQLELEAIAMAFRIIAAYRGGVSQEIKSCTPFSQHERRCLKRLAESDRGLEVGP